MKDKTAQNAKVPTTQAEMRAAIKSAKAREQYATKIRSVNYDKRADIIETHLSTGALLAIPRRKIPGFTRAGTRRPSDVYITPGGEGLWSDLIDDGVLLEQLLILALGERTLGAVGARVNARKKSPARAAASRANGGKGGRPKKSAA